MNSKNDKDFEEQAVDAEKFEFQPENQYPDNMEHNLPMVTDGSMISSFSTKSAQNRFKPGQIKLTCPIHDNMPFKYFCKAQQTYLCNMCVLDKGQGVSADWLDLNAISIELGKRFEK